MSDKTPDNKKTAPKSGSDASSPEKSPPPLNINSSDLSPTQAHTSNLRFGAIGGPTTPLAAQNSRKPFQHTTSLANLSVAASSTQRTLRSNQPGESYVTKLRTWRRDAGPEATAPAAKDEGDGVEDLSEALRNTRIDDDDSRARASARAIEYQQQELEKYNSQKQQQQQNQQIVPYQSQGFGGSRGFGRSNMGVTRAPFRPMNSKLDPEAASRPLTEEEKAHRDMKGISHKYQGDSNNPANESANIPEWENCSVWLTNLPPDCTYRDLLGAIAAHHPGKVFATYISPPSGTGPAYLASRGHCAAKVVFYYPWAARNLIYVANNTGLWVRGYPARAVPNRIRAAPQAYGNDTTRCLMITGPADVVNQATLYQIWDGYFDFHTEEVLTVDEEVDYRGVTIRTIIWRFGSHRAQAIAAHKYIEDHLPCVAVSWASDPCDVQIRRP